jgi:hypothetical protein
MKIVFIAATDFVLIRGQNGNSHDLDIITFLSQNTDSLLLYTHNWNFQTVSDFKPDIIYLFDCDRPRNHFNGIIKKSKTLNVPICLLGDDLFHVNLVSSDHNTFLCDAIISIVQMSEIQKEYKKIFPTKYIGSLYQHYVNIDKFKNRDIPKEYDIIIYGTINFENETMRNGLDSKYFEKWKKRTGNTNVPIKFDFYPLRKRVADLILNSKKYKVNFIPTPSNQCWSCPIKGYSLSQEINKSYIGLATSSRSDKCMQKYLEISASDAIILGNIPTDFYELFVNNIIEISEDMSDKDILEKIDTCLSDKKSLETTAILFGKEIRNKHGDTSSNKMVEQLIIMSNEIIEHFKL